MNKNQDLINFLNEEFKPKKFVYKLRYDIRGNIESLLEIYCNNVFLCFVTNLDFVEHDDKIKKTYKKIIKEALYEK